MRVSRCTGDRERPGSFFPVAAVNLMTSPAGTGPRSFPSMPCALAHPRTSAVFGPLARAPPLLRPAAGSRPRPGGQQGHSARQRLSQRRGMPGGQVDLIPGAVRPDATVPPAPVPSRSSMSRVCIFGAADAPSRCLIGRASARRSGPRQRPAAPICQPVRARADRRCRAAGRAPIRSLPVRAGEDLLVPPEMGASAQRAGRGRQPARSSGTVPPVPPATGPDGLCRCG